MQRKLKKASLLSCSKSTTSREIGTDGRKASGTRKQERISNHERKSIIALAFVFFYPSVFFYIFISLFLLFTYKEIAWCLNVWWWRQILQRGNNKSNKTWQKRFSPSTVVLRNVRSSQKYASSIAAVVLHTFQTLFFGETTRETKLVFIKKKWRLSEISQTRENVAELIFFHNFGRALFPHFFSSKSRKITNEK